MTYDAIGRRYARHRQPEPRWERAVAGAVGSARSVLNVGAGTGSYEPAGPRVLAVEPSQVMVAQRPPDAAPVLRAVAEALPFATASFDVGMAILTVHHWADAGRGLAELRRVSHRQVVMTWDPAVTAQFWLARDYLPEAQQREEHLATAAVIIAALGPAARMVPLPVPADCADGVFAAYWRRPEAYLDAGVRAAMSAVALLPEPVVSRAVARLAVDLADGTWARRYGHLLELPELDAGYRLITVG
jgi:SAM-dependent methyltransferase